MDDSVGLQAAVAVARAACGRGGDAERAPGTTAETLNTHTRAQGWRAVGSEDKRARA
jgi:hypothetical protein